MLVSPALPAAVEFGNPNGELGSVADESPEELLQPSKLANAPDRIQPLTRYGKLFIWNSLAAERSKPDAGTLCATARRKDAD
jgi:hypothetical protein